MASTTRYLLRSRAPAAFFFGLLLAAQSAHATAPPLPPRFDHVVIVIMENHGFSQIIGDTTDAPYINLLALTGANFTQSFAIEHPSQPNYLDLYSGANQGSTGTDNCFASLVSGGNLGGQLLAANFSFAGYSEDLPAAGSTDCTSGLYARKHNPWSDFVDTAGTGTNLPFTAFPADFTTLPSVSFVVPNQCNDMHNSGCALTPIKSGDTWLQANLDTYVQWAPQHNSLLIVTWDENDSSIPNQIPTIFYGALVIPGDYSETIDHFSVLATLEAMYGLTALGGAATKTAITDVFDHRIFANGFE